jgi:hypothetical protein
MTRLEFWPDYGPGPLWDEDGNPVDLGLLGISQELAERVRLWNSHFEEERIPVDGPGNTEWLAEGAILLQQLRTDLGPDVDVVVTEPWWGETPT